MTGSKEDSDRRTASHWVHDNITGQLLPHEQKMFEKLFIILLVFD